MFMRISVLTVSLLAAAFQAQAANEDLKGVWARGDGNARVRIDDCGGAVCATNLWIKPGTRSEKAGDKLIMTVAPSGPGAYKGKAKDPQRGLTYNLEIKATKTSMTTRGCVLGGIICKSVAWSRIQ